MISLKPNRPIAAVLAVCLLLGLTGSAVFAMPVVSQGQSQITVSVNDSANGQDTTNVSVTVSNDSDDTSVPSDWDGNSEQYFAIYEDGERPGTQEMSAKLNNWFRSNDGTVDGVEFGTQEISSALNYWFAGQ